MVTKRFASLRTSLGLSRPGVVFHSTRKWFVTQCERAGVPEHFTASIFGHQSARSENRMTYGIYSAGIYGPWWQQVSKELRDRIFINDRPTVEVDFKGLHLAIIAAQQGISIDGDPYTLPPETVPGTRVFSVANDSAWRVVANWRRKNTAEVSSAIEAVREDLEGRVERDLPTLLHIGGIFRELSAEGLIPETRADVVKLMTEYVDGLRSSRLMDPALPLCDWEDDPLTEQQAYGLGYHERETAEFREISDALRAAREGAFWDKNLEIAGNLLETARENAERFRLAIREISGTDAPTNYAYVPVLAVSNPARFAELVCSLHPGDAERAQQPFQDRIPRLARNSKPDWPDERAWLVEVRDEILRIAGSTEEPIRKAQLRSLADWRLGFLDPQPEDQA